MKYKRMYTCQYCLKAHIHESDRDNLDELQRKQTEKCRLKKQSSEITLTTRG